MCAFPRENGVENFPVVKQILVWALVKNLANCKLFTYEERFVKKNFLLLLKILFLKNYKR